MQQKEGSKSAPQTISERSINRYLTKNIITQKINVSTKNGEKESNNDKK